MASTQISTTRPKPPPQIEYKDIPLCAYKENRVGQAAGLQNIGAICYFNSVIQCLLSCPSITETIEKHIEKNPLVENKISFVKMLHDLFSAAEKGAPIHTLHIPIWQAMIIYAKTRKDTVLMDSGQQDAQEGLLFLLDLATKFIPDIRILFEHRYLTEIHCANCKSVVLSKSEQNLILEVQANLANEQIDTFKDLDKHYGKPQKLEDFIQANNGFVEGYRCPKCGNMDSKFKQVKLKMTPEILCITLKKYHKKIRTVFPSEFEFTGKNGPIRYIQVAQSEHSGGMGGGHYWAICKRQNGWKNLNDSSVSDAQPGPTENTYMVFYHVK